MANVYELEFAAKFDTSSLDAFVSSARAAFKELESLTPSTTSANKAQSQLQQAQTGAAIATGEVPPEWRAQAQAAIDELISGVKTALTESFGRGIGQLSTDALTSSIERISTKVGGDLQAALRTAADKLNALQVGVTPSKGVTDVVAPELGAARPIPGTSEQDVASAKALADAQDTTAKETQLGGEASTAVADSAAKLASAQAVAAAAEIEAADKTKARAGQADQQPVDSAPVQKGVDDAATKLDQAAQAAQGLTDVTEEKAAQLRDTELPKTGSVAPVVGPTDAERAATQALADAQGTAAKETDAGRAGVAAVATSASALAGAQAELSAADAEAAAKQRARAGQTEQRVDKSGVQAGVDQEVAGLGAAAEANQNLAAAAEAKAAQVRDAKVVETTVAGDVGPSDAQRSAADALASAQESAAKSTDASGAGAARVAGATEGLAQSQESAARDVQAGVEGAGAVASSAKALAEAQARLAVAEADAAAQKAARAGQKEQAVDKTGVQKGVDDEVASLAAASDANQNLAAAADEKAAQVRDAKVVEPTTQGPLGPSDAEVAASQALVDAETAAAKTTLAGAEGSAAVAATGKALADSQAAAAADTQLGAEDAAQIAASAKALAASQEKLAVAETDAAAREEANAGQRQTTQPIDKSRIQAGVDAEAAGLQLSAEAEGEVAAASKEKAAAIRSTKPPAVPPLADLSAPQAQVAAAFGDEYAAALGAAGGQKALALVLEDIAKSKLRVQTEDELSASRIRTAGEKVTAEANARREAQSIKEQDAANKYAYSNTPEALTQTNLANAAQKNDLATDSSYLASQVDLKVATIRLSAALASSAAADEDWLAEMVKGKTLLAQSSAIETNRLASASELQRATADLAAERLNLSAVETEALATSTAYIAASKKSAESKQTLAAAEAEAAATSGSLAADRARVTIAQSSTAAREAELLAATDGLANNRSRSAIATSATDAREAELSAITEDLANNRSRLTIAQAKTAASEAEFNAISETLAADRSKTAANEAKLAADVATLNASNAALIDANVREAAAKEQQTAREAELLATTTNVAASRARVAIATSNTAAREAELLAASDAYANNLARSAIAMAETEAREAEARNATTQYADAKIKLAAADKQTEADVAAGNAANADLTKSKVQLAEENALAAAREAEGLAASDSLAGDRARLTAATAEAAAKEEELLATTTDVAASRARTTAASAQTAADEAEINAINKALITDRTRLATATALSAAAEAEERVATTAYADLKVRAAVALQEETAREAAGKASDDALINARVREAEALAAQTAKVQELLAASDAYKENLKKEADANSVISAAKGGPVADASIQEQVNKTIQSQLASETLRLEVINAQLGEDKTLLNLMAESKVKQDQLNEAIAKAVRARETEAAAGAGGGGGFFGGLAKGIGGVAGGGGGGVSGALNSFGEQAGQLLAFSAVTGVFFTMGSRIRQTLKDAEDFDAELQVVKAQVDAIGQGSQFEGLRTQIVAISEATGVAGKDVATLAAEFVGLYGSAEAAAGAAESAAKILKVTGDSAQVAGPQIGAIADSLNVSVQDVGNAVVDIQTRTGRSGADALTALSQIAPVVAEMGGSFDNARGLIEATLTGTAKSAQQAGDALARILPQIQKNLPKIASDGIVLSIDAKNGNAIAAINDVLSQFDKLTQAQKQQLVSDLGGPRNAQVLAALLGDATNAQKLLNGSVQDGNGLNTRNAQIQETLAASTARLKTEFVALGQEVLHGPLGAVLQEAVRDMGLLLGFAVTLGAELGKFDRATGGFASQVLEAVVAFKVIQQIIQAINTDAIGKTFSNIKAKITGESAQVSAAGLTDELTTAGKITGDSLVSGGAEAAALLKEGAAANVSAVAPAVENAAPVVAASEATVLETGAATAAGNLEVGSEVVAANIELAGNAFLATVASAISPTVWAGVAAGLSEAEVAGAEATLAAATEGAALMKAAAGTDAETVIAAANTAAERTISAAEAAGVAIQEAVGRAATVLVASAEEAGAAMALGGREGGAAEAEGGTAAAGKGLFAGIAAKAAGGAGLGAGASIGSIALAYAPIAAATVTLGGIGFGADQLQKQLADEQNKKYTSFVAAFRKMTDDQLAAAAKDPALRPPPGLFDSLGSGQYVDAANAAANDANNLIGRGIKDELSGVKRIPLVGKFVPGDLLSFKSKTDQQLKSDALALTDAQRLFKDQHDAIDAALTSGNLDPGIEKALNAFQQDQTNAGKARKAIDAWNKFKLTPAGQQVETIQQAVAAQNKAMNDVNNQMGTDITDVSQFLSEYQAGNVDITTAINGVKADLAALGTTAAFDKQRKADLKELANLANANIKAKTQAALDIATATGTDTPQAEIGIYTTELTDPSADQATKLEAAKKLADAEKKNYDALYAQAKANGTLTQFLSQPPPPLSPEVSAALTIPLINQDGEWNTWESSIQNSSLTAVEKQMLSVENNVAYAVQLGTDVNFAIKKRMQDEVARLKALLVSNVTSPGQFQQNEQIGNLLAELDTALASSANLPTVTPPTGTQGTANDTSKMAQKLSDQAAQFKAATGLLNATNLDPVEQAKNTVKEAIQEVQAAQTLGFTDQSSEMLAAKTAYQNGMNQLATALETAAKGELDLAKAQTQDPVQQAVIDVQIANQAVADAAGKGPAAIYAAQAQLAQAQNAVVNSNEAVVAAELNYVKSQSQDPVQQANADLAIANQAVRDSAGKGGAAYYNAEAQRNNALQAVADTNAAVAVAGLNFAKAFAEDPLNKAIDDVRLAIQAVQSAKGKGGAALENAKAQYITAIQGVAAAQEAIAVAQLDYTKAQTEDPLKKAEIDLQLANLAVTDAANKGTVAMGQALDQRVAAEQAVAAANQAIVVAELNLAKAQNQDNPVAVANADLAIANQAVRDAAGKGAAAIDAALAQQLAAQKAVTDAQNAIEDAQLKLAEAQDTATGHPVAAAQIQLQLLQQQLARVQALAPNDQNQVAILDLEAQIATAQANIVTTQVNTIEKSVKDQLALRQITTGTAIARLRDLESLAVGNSDLYNQIALEIQNLQQQSNTQFNLPANLNLPTLYQARRLDQTPVGTNYSSSQVVNITINANNTLDVAAAQQMLANAIGAGSQVYGTVPRRF